MSTTKHLCLHQLDADALSCVCTSPRVIQTAERVPLDYCGQCPYRVTPDYFAATEQLLTHKQRTGQYVAKPKPCGGCPELTPLSAGKVPAVRSEPPTDGLQFVWVYWAGGAALDELRYSIRSVESNYQGKAKITIVGDRPPWFSGHVIAQRRQKTRDKGFQKGLRDVLAKMHTISRHPDIDNEFVWMMDDVFMVQPTTYRDLVTPRADGLIRTTARGNRWRTVKTNTGRRLSRNGFTTYDYGTHLPHHVLKGKLSELFATWKPLEHVFLWEVAYGNTYRTPPLHAVPFLKRLGREYTAEEYDGFAQRSSFLNVAQNGWGPSLRSWLRNRFPEQASEESGAPPVKIAGKVRNEPIDEHLILIQSCYDREPMSRARLEVSRQTAIPSLTQQTKPVSLVVMLHRDDPLHDERVAAFELTGQNVRFVYAESWGLTVPDEVWQLEQGPRNLVGRLDDDDILPIDFAEISQARAKNCDEHGVLVWPNGYVLHGGQLHRLRHPENQFCALVSRDGSQPHAACHRTYIHGWPTLHAEHSRGWIWVRHGEAETDTKPRYLRNPGAEAHPRRFPFEILRNEHAPVVTANN